VGLVDGLGFVFLANKANGLPFLLPIAVPVNNPQEAMVFWINNMLFFFPKE
jgi:hypothetical protein